MSAVAVPPTQTCGFRPPIVPPNVTTFDGSPSPDGDPYEQVLLRDAQDTLDAFYRRPPDEFACQTWLNRLLRRQATLALEITGSRLIAGELLPPPLMGEFPQAFAGSEQGILGKLVGVQAEIDAAVRALKQEIAQRHDEIASFRALPEG
jgi:hypothetical protein